MYHLPRKNSPRHCEVMSADGNKVKCKHSFTEKEKEELQSRTVEAENLPEDHSHQNLQKIFTVVGSVKTIRVCHPPESNSSRPKSEVFISNKLYALVEYEMTDIAEKAVEKLNDERNWRKGMRVRLLLRCSVMEQLVNRLDMAMFNGILWESDEKMLTGPISDPISDSKVLPIPAGKLDFGSAAQLKNACRTSRRWILYPCYSLLDDTNGNSSNWLNMKDIQWTMRNT